VKRAAVPFGEAGLIQCGHDEGKYVWVIDDRKGPSSMGGFYLCEFSPNPDRYRLTTEWYKTAAKAIKWVPDCVSWMPVDESEPIVALMPVESARLKRLVDERRFEELSGLVSLEKIAETWMRYQRLDNSRAALRDWWAVDLWMNEGWWSDEKRVRDGLLRLVEHAESDDDFGNLGAAVMEVFISADEGRLVWVDQQAAGSEKFREAMSHAWVWELPDQAFRRMEKAAGVALRDVYEEERARRLGEL
jgi:hypothetical protein